MKRVKVSVLLAPATIYQHAARVAEGYAVSADARFAVVRSDAHNCSWLLVHRRTGAPVASLLPTLRRKVTLRDLLAVCASWHAASHLEWDHFDRLPQTTRETTRVPDFDNRDAAMRVGQEMRALAAQAVPA